jgi:hypothetical protein
MRHDFSESPTKAEGAHHFSESPLRAEAMHHEVAQSLPKASGKGTHHSIKMPQDSKRSILQINDRIIEGAYD